MFTDGAKRVAAADGAYWLLDEIALAQRYDKAVEAEAFQLWRLTVHPASQVAHESLADHRHTMNHG